MENITTKNHSLLDYLDQQNHPTLLQYLEQYHQHQPFYLQIPPNVIELETVVGKKRPRRSLFFRINPTSKSEELAGSDESDTCCSKSENSLFEVHILFA